MKRTEITIESDRLVVLSKRKVSVVSWCRECNQRVKMITVDEAASIAGVTSRTMYRWADAEELHFTETSEGRLLICCESLVPLATEGLRLGGGKGGDTSAF